MRRAVAAVVDFVVGEDVLVAAGVGLALVVTWAAVRLGADPWWLLGLSVPAVLAVSLWRVTRAEPESRSARRARSAAR